MSGNALLVVLALAAAASAVAIWLVLRPLWRRASRAEVVPLRPVADAGTAAEPAVPQPALPKPASVEKPRNTSASRWVGALIDKRPDEAAAVLKRWLAEK